MKVVCVNPKNWDCLIRGEIYTVVEHLECPHCNEVGYMLAELPFEGGGSCGCGMTRRHPKTYFSSTLFRPLSFGEEVCHEIETENIETHELETN